LRNGAAVPLPWCHVPNTVLVRCVGKC
jgi:hypothetical protein